MRQPCGNIATTTRQPRGNHAIHTGYTRGNYAATMRRPRGTHRRFLLRLRCREVWRLRTQMRVNTRLPRRRATTQMRRAAVSISSNLAGGCSRSSKSNYARLVEIVTGSVFEVVSQATIGRNQGFLDQTSYDQLYAAAEKQSRMLSGLRNSLVAS